MMRDLIKSFLRKNSKEKIKKKIDTKRTDRKT